MSQSSPLACRYIDYVGASTNCWYGEGFMWVWVPKGPAPVEYSYITVRVYIYMADNTEDQQRDLTYMGPSPAQPPTNDVPCTDWVRQQVLNHKAKAAGYQGTGSAVPVGEGWTIGKLAPPPPKYELATTEYVDQQVAEAVDSIRDSMATSAKWVNRRIGEEIAKEKASAYRFLLNQVIWFLVGLVVGMLFWWWYG